MPTVVVDTGVWYSIFDARDRVRDRKNVEDLAERLSLLTIAVPWPTMYEMLRTRFVNNRAALEMFERQLKAPNVEFVDDLRYREDALRLAIDSSLNRGRPLSMVDCAIRLFLDDANTRIKYLATYNIPDFADVCRHRRIEILGA
jgi:hypothetical protein